VRLLSAERENIKKRGGSMKRAIIVMSVVMMFVMVAGAGLSADVSWGVKGGVK
jgi:hypothetical protein